MILNAAGGECLDDFAHLRKDALGEVVGHELPSPEAARNFLYQFHDEEQVEEARKQLGAGKSSYIRDGNVPAQQQPLPVTKRAFEALPGQVTEYDFRGDSACHEAEWINWLRHENRANGPKGGIGFAGSQRAYVSVAEKASSAAFQLGMEAVPGR